MGMFSIKSRLRSRLERWFVSASPTWLRLSLYRNLEEDRRIIQASRLFNEAYYFGNYPETRQEKLDPIVHYCLFGWRLGYNPSEYFDTQFYLRSNPDIQRAQINPLLHYLSSGAAEERSPIPNFEQLKEENQILEDIAYIRSSGCFDAGYYNLMHPDFRESGLDPVEHFCRQGWRLDYNPSEEFDTAFYIKTYPEVSRVGINPFAHFLQRGLSESKRPTPGRLNCHEKEVYFGTISSEIKVLAFYHEHDQCRSGDGLTNPLHVDEEVQPLESFDVADPADPHDLQRQVQLARNHGFSAFCFDVGSDHISCANLFHSMPSAWNSFFHHKEIDFHFCLRVAPSAAPAQALASFLAPVMEDPRYLQLHQRPVLLLKCADVDSDQESPQRVVQLRQFLKSLLAVDPFLIASLEHHSECFREGPNRLIFNAVVSAPHWVQPLSKKGVDYLPYQAVVAAGMQDMDHADNGSCAQYHSISLSRYGQQCAGQPHPAYTQFTLADFRHWLDAAIAFQRRHHLADERLLFIQSWNNWNDGQVLEPDKIYGYARLNTTAKSLLGLEQDQPMPMVSIVVPNYNHEKYLRRRLESIYQQTYPNYEVILLDDCSTDASRELLSDYARAYPSNTRCLFSDQNSGGVFRQWAKGIKAARGELVWIAESDDYCALNFLEQLIKEFNDEAVLLAYCKPVFVDQHENSLPYDFASYLEELDCSERWSTSYVQTAHQEVCSALGIKNTIPNASGVLFRRPISLPLLDDPDWLAMRVAGDWVFYLHVILGGKIAYSTATTNYFRRHNESTAGLSYTQSYFYREIGKANRVVASLYDVPVAVHEKAYQAIQNTFIYWLGEEKIGILSTLFDYAAILRARRHRLPNICISTTGFYPGGAEIFPIRLANELRRRGLSVTLLSCGLSAREYHVRAMADPNLPVVETADPEATRTIVCDYSIDVLNSHHWGIQNYPNLLSDVFSGLKAHVASLHGQLENDSAFFFESDQLSIADRNVTTWVYTAEKNLTPFHTTGLWQTSSASFLKLPNGIQAPEKIEVDRQRFGIPEDAFVLCCVSRAIPEKGWSEMIDVVREARFLSGRDIRLMLVGHGPVYDELRQQKLPDFLILTGYRDHSSAFYAAADMGIMLTKFKSESFPLTIADCLFAGKPFIASDVGEIRAMLSEGQGLAGAVIPLMEWEPPIQIAVDEVLKFVHDHALYSQACLLAKHISRRYRIEGVASQYLAVMISDINNSTKQASKGMGLKSWVSRQLPNSAPVWLQQFFYSDFHKHVELIRESGQFDEAFYHALYSEALQDLPDPVSHYCLLGWRLGFDPSDDFDTSFYLATNEDIRRAGMNPFLHYITSGAAELRQPKPSLANIYQEDVWFGRFHPSVQLLALYREPDWHKYQQDRHSPAVTEGPFPHKDFGFYPSADPEVLRRQVRLASSHGLSGFCFEVASPIPPGKPAAWRIHHQTVEIDFAFCLKIDCTSTPGDTSFLSTIGPALLDPRAFRIHGRPILLLLFHADPSATEWLIRVRAQLSTFLGVNPFLIGCLSEMNAISCGAIGSLDGLMDQSSVPIPSETGSFTPIEKPGFDFVPYKVVLAAGLHRARMLHPTIPSQFHCITLGRHGQPSGSSRPLIYSNFTLADYRHWLDIATHQLRANPAQPPVLFVNSWNNWNEGQVLEPDKDTGYARLNTTTRCLLAIPQEQSLPKVSIIVPKISDQQRLLHTLSTITSQSYRNLEVILLADSDPAKHPDALSRYLESNLEHAFFVAPAEELFPFHWSRALPMAHGDLVWVVDPDATCDPDFLKTLVRAFDDEAVMLACCQISGGQQERLGYVRTAHQAVPQSLGLRNIITSLGAAVFRRPDSLPLLMDHGWLSMKYCGEWLFSLHIILGGKLAYNPDVAIVLPPERCSADVEITSISDLIQEVATVHRAVASHYRVSDAWLEQARESCRAETCVTGVSLGDTSFEALYDFQAIVKAKIQRVPNILVSTMGFYPGGAEILPIRLANEFKRAGLSVTLLSTGLHSRQYGVRCLLRRDIPVVETSDLEQTRDLIRDFGIDVLNSHQWHVQNYPNLLPDVFRDIAHVASLHGMIEHGTVQKVSRVQLSRADESVTSWIYTADKNLVPFENHHLIQSSTARFIKLPNGMSPPQIEPVSRQQLGIPEDAFVLCCVSRAIPEKGWHEAIEVVRRSRERTGRDIRLILVGNGNLYDAMRLEGCPSFVVLVGFSNNSVGHYAAADMGIMLTRFRSESFPLTIVDCLFAGKPYLATDVGEIRNILTEGSRIAGDVIPLQDWDVPIEQVVDSLVEFLSDRDHYSKACELASTVANRYRIDVVASQYIEIFKEDVALVSQSPVDS